MSKPTLSRRGTFTIPLSSGDEQSSLILNRTASAKAVDAIIWVLSKKWRMQPGLIDRKLYVLVAKTGAGKSTMLIYELYNRFIKRRRRGILLCTQPRIILAQSKAKEMPLYYDDLTLGVNIGFKTSSASIRVSSGKGISYVTTETVSILLAKLEPRIFGRLYPIIVIDEAHETDIPMMLTLRQIKTFLTQYSEESWCPLVIITSATIDPITFLEYYGMIVDSPYNSGSVSGSTNFPIEEVFVDEDSTLDIVNLSVSTTLGAIRDLDMKLERQTISSPAERYDDILIMHKGTREIRKTMEALDDVLGHTHNVFRASDIYPLKEPPESVREDKIWYVLIMIRRGEVINLEPDYLIASKERLEGERRIYVSTPVLESGITINNLGYIIDSARKFAMMPFPLGEISSLLPMPISMSSMLQRKGRVGRKAPGIYIGLYPETLLNEFPMIDYPATVVSNDSSMDYLSIIVGTHLLMFLEFGRTIANISKLIAFQRTKPLFPMFDFLNSPDLLHDFSFDIAVMGFRTLYLNGLVTRDGQLTSNGYQLSLVKGSSVAGRLLNILMMKELIHPFDMILITMLLKDCMRQFTFGGKIVCDLKVEEFFIESERRRIVKPTIAVFRLAQELILLLENPSTSPSAISEWAISHKLIKAKIMSLVTDAIREYREEREVTVPMYAEATEEEKVKILRSLRKVINSIEGIESVLTIVKEDPRDYFLGGGRSGITLDRRSRSGLHHRGRRWIRLI